jgi:hypothetical protein
MGASSATPVEKLRDKGIKKKRTHFFYHGLCVSIMFAPEDGVTALFPRIETMTNGQLNGVFLF